MFHDVSIPSIQVRSGLVHRCLGVIGQDGQDPCLGTITGTYAVHGPAAVEDGDLNPMDQRFGRDFP